MKEHIWYIHEYNELFVDTNSPQDVVSQDLADYINGTPKNRKVKLFVKEQEVSCHVEQDNGINIFYIGEL